MRAELHMPQAPGPGEPPRFVELPFRPQLVVVRGLRYSGKSALAQDLVARGWTHIEPAQFFEMEHGGTFVRERLPEARAWCMSKTREALAAGTNVVVTDTLHTLVELSQYIGLGAAMLVLRTKAVRSDVHEAADRNMVRLGERPVAPSLLANSALFRHLARAQATAQ